MAGLTGFAREHSFAAGRFTATGAFSAVMLGFFDWEQKHYKKISLREGYGRDVLLMLMDAFETIVLPRHLS